MDQKIHIQITFTQERDGDLYNQIKEEFKSIKLRNRCTRLKQLLHSALNNSNQIAKPETNTLKPAAYKKTKVTARSKSRDENREITDLLLKLAIRLGQ